MSADERIGFVLGHAVGAIATAALSNSVWNAIVASVLVALLHLALWAWKR